MALFLARNRSALARIASKSRPSFSKRFMSADDNFEQIKEESTLWMKYSLGFSLLVGAAATYSLLDHFSHHDHHHEETEFTHLHVRTKPYPWECSHCNLVDSECYLRCKEERAAE
mmetsp:Transcript_3099/g.4742  ORF Transcript_3099/g.4742 Transcript_3099/m.4742 type:complete len:115 (-) Transcript_3099:58-402(-)